MGRAPGVGKDVVSDSLDARGVSRLLEQVYENRTGNERHTEPRPMTEKPRLKV